MTSVQPNWSFRLERTERNATAKSEPWWSSSPLGMMSVGLTKANSPALDDSITRVPVGRKNSSRKSGVTSFGGTGDGAARASGGVGMGLSELQQSRTTMDNRGFIFAIASRISLW